MVLTGSLSPVFDADRESGAVIVQSRGGWLCFRKPVHVLVAENLSAVKPILEEVDRATNRGLWAAGFMSYEAAPAFDEAFVTRPYGALPLLWFGIYNQPDEWSTLPDFPLLNAGIPIWNPTVSREEYTAAIAQIKEYIARGDSYQVNYTMRLRSAFQGSAWALFASLVRAQEPAYAGFVNSGNHILCSASPELFFHLSGNDIICRPMKGTAPRGLTTDADLAHQERLLHSVKERAENVMIVDMVRNDLSRIAEPGSVRVPRLFDVERYFTVHQLTSTVVARTRAPLNEIFAALFPCASITGAPKIRTMRIISELESSPRGIYTGCIGFAAPNRQAQFNVAIRTVHIDRAQSLAEYGTGGGIVWDSRTDEEYEETKIKAAILFTHRPEFQLLETILWRPGSGYFLPDRHLDRVCVSADYFNFAIDRKAVISRLAESEKTFSNQPYKVRLLIARNGYMEIEAAPLQSSGSRRWRVVLAKNPVDMKDRFLYHKTTHRAVYENARSERPGYDEIILWNAEGRITESTTANIVIQSGGRLITPPVCCGLLGGVYRAHLLACGRIQEGNICKPDLLCAEKVYLINSVRGWMPVKLD